MDLYQAAERQVFFALHWVSDNESGEITCRPSGGPKNDKVYDTILLILEEGCDDVVANPDGTKTGMLTLEESGKPDKQFKVTWSDTETIFRRTPGVGPDA